MGWAGGGAAEGARTSVCPSPLLTNAHIPVYSHTGSGKALVVIRVHVCASLGLPLGVGAGSGKALVVIPSVG